MRDENIPERLLLFGGVTIKLMRINYRIIGWKSRKVKDDIVIELGFQFYLCIEGKITYGSFQ